MRKMKILCTALALSLAVSQAGAVDWGLSYNNGLNKPPSGEESAETLKKYNAFYMGDPSKKTLYLTFDAGYENGNTPKILDTLKKHHVPAAFFVLSGFLDEAPELAKRIADEGHLVCNHSATHPNMTRVSRARFENELNTLASKYKSVTGKDLARFYRPPEGSYTHSNLIWAKEMGYDTILWSVAHMDWEPSAQPSYATGLSTVRNRTHPGAIILLHSVSSTNAAILDELITKWKAEGYSFASISSIPGVKNYASTAIPNNAAFLINGEKAAPTSYLIDGSNYLKLRDFAKMLSGTNSEFSVAYDPALKRVSLESGKPYDANGSELKGYKDVTVMPAKGNYGYIWLNGSQLKVSAYLIENENYLNLRQLAKIFNSGIAYDEKTKAVSLTVPQKEEHENIPDETVNTETSETGTENITDN